MVKVGLAISFFQNRFGDLKALEIAKEIGADAVDFSLHDFGQRFDYRNPESIYSKSDEEIVSYFSAIRTKAEELGLDISQTHGRLDGFKNIEEEDKSLLENIRRDCLATSALGAPVCVIHAPTTIYLGANADPKLMHRLWFEMFTRTIAFARKYDIKIATETFGDATGLGCCDFFGSIKEFLIAYNRVKAIGENARYFTICVDTGHSNKATRFGHPSAGDVIRMCGSDVTVLHLNDNDTYSDQHKIPKTGTIDWDDVFDALDEIHYEGVYNLELELRHFGDNFIVEEGAFGIKVLKNLLNNRKRNEEFA